MHTPRLRHGALLAVAATLMSAVGLSPTHAADQNLQPVFHHYGAQILACKITHHHGRQVQLFVQLDNSHNRGQRSLTGGFWVSRIDHDVDTLKHRDIGPTRAGDRSVIRSVTVATGDEVRLQTDISEYPERRGIHSWSTSFDIDRLRAC